jgi:hypothetical protein
VFTIAKYWIGITMIMYIMKIFQILLTFDLDMKTKQVNHRSIISDKKPGRCTVEMVIAMKHT